MPLNNPFSLTGQLIASSQGENPSTRKCFKLFFNDLEGLTSSILRGVDDDQASSYLQKFKHGATGLPLEVDFRPPSMKVQQRSVRRQNVERKYAGFPEWSDCSLSLHNFVGLHTHRFFFMWALMCAGCSNSINDRDFIGLREFVNRAPVNSYKVDATVRHFVGHNVDLETEWTLKGIFPISVAVDDYDNSDDGSLHLTNVDFSVDFAFISSS
jgi:hypothetical protein